MEAFIHATSQVFTLVNYLFVTDNEQVLFCEAFSETVSMIQLDIEVCEGAQTSIGLVQIVEECEDAHIVSTAMILSFQKDRFEQTI